MKNLFSRTGSRANRRGKRSRGRQRRAHFETLEPRHVLAGNITATVVDGDLRLAGDRLDNSAIVSVVDGDVVVEGLDDTTVNGSDTPFIAFSATNTITDDFLARLGDGDDVLLLAGGLEVAGRVAISGGGGSARVALDDVTLGDNVYIVGTPGGDVIHFDDVDVSGNIAMRLKQGDDVVQLRDTVVDDLVIRMARGDDAVVLESLTSSDDVYLATGHGSDDVVVQDATISDDLVIRTHSGHDFVTIDPSTIGDHLVGRFGRGNDSFVDQGGNRYGRVSIRGGRGRDAADFDPATIIDGARVVRKTELDAVAETVIDARLNDPEDGALTKATAAAEFFAMFLDEPELMLTVDTSANETIESNDTLLTNKPTFNIAGTTGAGATVDVDRDGDGAFDDGTATADTSGAFSLDVTLVHDDDNRGANVLTVRATRDGEEVSEEVTVHLAVGTVVRFDSTLGRWDVELLDADAPNTVAAFLQDLSRYDATVVHRNVEEFVVQGGSFSFDALTPAIVNAPDFPEVPNEFAAADPPNSNEQGTISTAQTSDPDSFRGSWFFNTVDNNSDGNVNLDNVPHTPYGRVIGTGMTVVDAIQAAPTFGIGGTLPNSAAFAQTPLVDYTPVYEPLSGTVSVSDGSRLVVGAGTSFASDLARGQGLRIEGEEVAVADIISDTLLELVRPHEAGAIGVVAEKNTAAPGAESFVTINSVTSILDPPGSMAITFAAF